jgi:hypothetical protein
MTGPLSSQTMSKNAASTLADPIIYRASDNQEAQRRVRMKAWPRAAETA